jgi:uncharacterized protein involved in exopolysaccharide biosynthesis
MQTTLTTIPRGGLTARAGVEAFFRRRRLFSWVVLAILLITALVTLLKPREYVSEMKFLIQNNRGNVVITPERTAATNAVGDVTEAQVNSELEILHSHDVIDPVADADWSKTPGSEPSIDEIRKHEKRLAAFERRYTTDVVRKTNVITVGIAADTPQNAKDELERLSAAFLAEHRRLQRPDGASQFFKSEAERVRNDWDEASRKLVEFQQAHQVVSVSDRQAALNSQITDHERELLATDATLKEMDTRLAASTTRLNQLPMRQTTAERVLPNQESVQHLNTLLVELQNKRTALLTNYKSDDRFVAELDKQIETTKAALADATVSTAHERTTDVDPAWQDLHTNYVQTEIARRQAATHRANLASELAALRQNLANLQELTVQFNNLETQANQAKQNYELYAQKSDQAQVEDAMDEQKLLNVVVAQQPTLSYIAKSPRPVTNAILGTVTALFLALCAVYLAENGRNAIATPRELDAISRYPVLATVPQMSLWERPILEAAKEDNRRARALPSPLADASQSLQRTLLDSRGDARA